VAFYPLVVLALLPMFISGIALCSFLLLGLAHACANACVVSIAIGKVGGWVGMRAMLWYFLRVF